MHLGVVKRRIAALALAALAAGCGRVEKPGPARPVGESVLPIRPAPRFRPPSDGVVTEEQVERFIRVRRAAKGRTDAEAARALGIFPEEIAWTRARVIEALVALDERRVREASAEVYAKSLSSLKAARSSTRNPGDARVLDEQISALERERATIRREQTPSAPLALNMKRISSHRAELEPLAP